jgi:hypothetical protein
MCDGFCATRVICHRVEHKTVYICIYLWGVSFIPFSAWQMSWGLPADAGFLRDQAAVLGDTLKVTHA